MQIHYGLEDLRMKAPVVTIGSFDGVHLGHLKVLDGLKKCAARLHGESVILTFDPHPREVLYPLEQRPGILTTLDEKIAILDRMGIDHLVVIRFTEALSALSYADFVKNILVDRIGIKALVVGYDHRFGKNREGNFDTLSDLAVRYGFYVEKEEVFRTEEVNVSSTKIRTALELGDIDRVKTLLGYDYPISGVVIHGDKIGRTIGFPTANICVNNERKLLPASGVYAVNVLLDGNTYKGMLNIGTRPTVSCQGIKRLEVHILDFSGDIYDQKLTVFLIARIRGERKFENLPELRIQLEKDREQTLKKLTVR